MLVTGDRRGGDGMADIAVEPIGPLGPLVTDATLAGEFRLRRDEYEYVSVHPSKEEEFITKGWELHVHGQNRVRLKRGKLHDVLLEDRMWLLLYRMGFPVISGKNFQIAYKRPDGSSGSKQVDVFAKDDETSLVIECKSCEQRRKRSLQKDLHETEALKKPISDAIRKQFGPTYKPKIIWLYVTTNIIWSEQDVERAEGSGIRIITENDLQYFEAFISHIGTAGRYQFLAEFLQGTEIPNLTNVKVPAVKGVLGKHTFYSFAITPRHLLKIAFVNHQALNHPDGRPAYQRMINKNRIKNIGKFIEGGGFFPTNILLNFVDKCRFDLLPKETLGPKELKFGWLYLPNKYKSAWVIDGQHRLYGFSNLPDKFLDQSLFILAFEKMDTKTEADLFITINHEQKSVPKSLLIALQADLKLGSSDPREAVAALCSGLVKALAADNTGPFYGRLSVPGIAPNERQNLTIPEFVKGLQKSSLIGRVMQKKSLVPGYLSAETDQKTIHRARRVINGYFRAIMDASPERWGAGRAAHICVNPGIRAHLQLMNEVLRHMEHHEGFDPYTANEDTIISKLTTFIAPIVAFFSSASAHGLEQKFARMFGEGGVVKYQFNLFELLLPKNPSFGPKEFHDYRAKQTDARSAQASRDILDLQEHIVRAVVETLKKLHGTHELNSGEKAYWELGIENLDIKQNAYKRQQMEPQERRATKEAYLEFIDCIKIIKQANNWEQFEPIFNLPMPDEKAGQKKYYLDWIEKLNELRRVAAHKTTLRNYQPADYEFVDWLKQHLHPRLEKSGFLD
jgi:DNA sulfur modification protein DndB